jgi:hypothetical protein
MHILRNDLNIKPEKILDEFNYYSITDPHHTNNSERMCILGNGNIGIGTTNPTSLFHLHNVSSAGEIKIFMTDASTGLNGFSLYKSTGHDGFIWNSFNAGLRFGTNNSERMCILGNGSIGVGTATPDSNFNLDVNGTIKCTQLNINGTNNTYLETVQQFNQLMIQYQSYQP